MNRLKKIIIKLFPHDKLAHYVLGMYIVMLTLPFMVWWQSLILTFLIALGIEFVDKISGKGNAEVLDILYTMAGGSSVIMAVTIINLIKTIVL